MDDKTQKLWHAKRLYLIAAKATAHASRRICAGAPAQVALRRSDRLHQLAKDAWGNATT